MLNPSS